VRLRSLLALALGLALSLAPAPAAAQAPFRVLEVGAENRFPQGVFFFLRLESEASVQEARLHYRLGPRAVPAVVAPEVEPGTEVDVGYLLGWPKVYLPPGVEIAFRWEVTDALGRAFATEEQTFVYTDPRFSFRTLEEGKVRLHWYGGDEDEARRLLQVAAATLRAMEGLLGVEVPFTVQVWVYADPGDMREALVPRSEAFDRQVITAGERVAKDTVLVAGTRSFDTLRHELAHVVTAVAGEGPFGGLPAWLDEGTAVYAQEEAGAFRRAFEEAVAEDRLLPLPSISTYPGDPRLVNLFYGQSWALVSYLIEAYGREKFARLFATFKEGATTDDALRRVYGLGVYELEDQWRRSLGLPPLSLPTPVPREEGRVPMAATEGPGPPWGLIAGAAGGVALTLAAYLMWRRALRGG